MDGKRGKREVVREYIEGMPEQCKNCFSSITTAVNVAGEYITDRISESALADRITTDSMIKVKNCASRILEEAVALVGSSAEPDEDKGKDSSCNYGKSDNEQ